MARKPVGQPSAEHRKRGFEPAFSLMTKQVRLAGEARGFAVARLLTHWPEIVGEDLARVTRPVKVGYGQGGMGATLTLLVQGAQASFLGMQLGQIREKVNAVYGYNAISRVHLTQTATSGFAEGQAVFGAKPDAPPADPVREAKVARAAAETAEGVSDPDLKAALELLALNVLSRPNKK